MPLCTCGCGGAVELETNKYIKGHNMKGKANFGVRLAQTGLPSPFKGKTRAYINSIKKGKKIKVSRKGVPNPKVSLALKGRPNLKLRGLKRTVEQCEKISLSNIGKKKPKLSLALKGKPNPNSGLAKRGKHYPNISLAKKGVPNLKLRGKFRDWCATVPFEVNKDYPFEFTLELKKQIRCRDNFTCQECKMIEEQLKYKLNIHHIDYNKKNNKPENLISLCRSCHSQTNFKRNDWTKYFQDKIGDSKDVCLPGYSKSS